tara:strand:- start:1578 stop:1709 length:132 start_codon:yes stop_codon:yes gene_type:complete
MKNNVLDRIDDLVYDLEEEGIEFEEILLHLKEYVEVVEELYGK